MLRHSLRIGAVLLALSSTLQAQTRTGTPRIPDGGTREVLLSIFIPSSTNAPFTATVNTEWVRTLTDGTTITLKNHRLIARDKSGRIFQERRLLVPDDGKSVSGITQTEISDPVLHRLYICVPRESVCQLEAFSPAETVLPSTNSAASKSGDTPGVESLGKQSIAGLEAVGTREIATIPTGAIGNDSPILTRREYWYSAQLGINLLSIRQDPRFGTQKFELSDVALGDPDEKLFEVPAGSKVIDLREQEKTASPAPPAS